MDAETQYPELDKVALALIVASRKLRAYFHTHKIEVLTNYSLCQVLQKSKALGRLLTWAIELSQFDISYRPQTAIKGQALEDFITEFTYAKTTEVARIVNVVEASE